LRITDELREALTPHLALKSDRVLPPGINPPTAVYALVAALVKPESIEASLVRVSLSRMKDPWTVWTVFVVTSTALAEVRAGFSGEGFNDREENSLYALNQQTTTDVKCARVDLLSEIVKAEFIAATKDATDIKIDQRSRDWLPLPRMKLKFADGRELFIPSQGVVNSSEIEESDKFQAAIRKRLPF
jgi:hypothetical protein